MEREIVEFAEGLGFVTEEGDGRVRFLLPCMGLMLLLEEISSEAVVPYFICRTRSWEWSGDRSDLHDITSSSLAAFLSCAALGSCELIGLNDPVNPALAAELHYQFVIPRQPINLSYRRSVETLSEPLFALHLFTRLWHTVMLEYCPSHAEDQDCRLDSPELRLWVDQIAQSLVGVLDPEEDLYIERVSPHHFYYRARAGNVSIVKSRSVVELLKATTHLRRDATWRSLNGVHGELHINGDLRNYVPWDDLAKAGSVLRGVGEDLADPTDVTIIALENSLLCASGEHMVSIESTSGRVAFQMEREAVLRRHQQEAEILFPMGSLRWSETIDAQRFEDLTRDLLIAEPGFVHVRSAGPVRERDGGRDLLVDAHTLALPGQTWSAQETNVHPIRIVVQCKATKRTVGRSDLPEIRDVIEDAEAQGFLLVTSSRVGASLVERLGAIRRRNQYWTDWWDRSELEIRLRRNPDILSRYPDIVEPISAGDLQDQ
jgi:Restriction endonuclease